jgi:hypothetical protein
MQAMIYSLFSFAFNIVISFLKYTTFFTALISGLAVLTKPQQQTFQPFLKEYIKSKGAPTSKIEGLLATMLSSTIASVIPVSHYDYLLFRVAKINIEGHDTGFIGVFNGWHCVH